VIAVMPVVGVADATAVYGYRVLTTGGELSVMDRKSADAVREYFYKRDHISPVTRPPVVALALNPNAH
jgi:hypothetical protein